MSTMARMLCVLSLSSPPRFKSKLALANPTFAPSTTTSKGGREERCCLKASNCCPREKEVSGWGGKGERTCHVVDAVKETRSRGFGETVFGQGDVTERTGVSCDAHGTEFPGGMTGCEWREGETGQRSGRGCR